jgi:hypothetical protein
MKLSERVAAGENTQELREDIARSLGWERMGGSYLFWEQNCGTAAYRRSEGCPNHLADIRLTLDEIEWRGWLSSHETLDSQVHPRDGCIFRVFDGSAIWKAYRVDRNLTLAAPEALLRAVESE